MYENDKYDAFDLTLLNEEEKLFREKCREFALDYIRPMADKYDRSESIDIDFFKGAINSGFYSPDFFLEVGLDQSGRKISIVAEEFAYGDGGLGLALLYPFLPLAALAISGTLEQQARFIPELFGSLEKPNLVAFAASEPDAGSDVNSISTTAVRDGDYFILNGVKRWAGNSSLADWYFVVASVEKDLGAKGQALFAVKGDSIGISFGSKMSKLGLRAMTHCDIYLSNVSVPLENLIGGVERLEKRIAKAKSGEHKIGQAAIETFEATRPFVAAMAVGVARAAHEEALKYSLSRVTFNKKIVEHQLVADKISRQRVMIDAARLLVYRAAKLQSQRLGFNSAEGSQAKLFAGEMVREVTLSALQVAGGLGFTKNLIIERCYRDAPIYGIFEGSNEIQSLIIASKLSGLKIR